MKQFFKSVSIFKRRIWKQVKLISNVSFLPDVFTLSVFLIFIHLAAETNNVFLTTRSPSKLHTCPVLWRNAFMNINELSLSFQTESEIVVSVPAFYDVSISPMVSIFGIKWKEGSRIKYEHCLSLIAYIGFYSNFYKTITRYRSVYCPGQICY